MDTDIAVSACSPEAVPRILEDLLTFGISPSIDEDDTRLTMLVSARALVRALETPRETMIRHNWAQVCQKGFQGILSRPRLTLFASLAVTPPLLLATTQAFSEYSRTERKRLMRLRADLE